ncbi:MAG TPA: decaprenyl-phosphate phosphoribosyltransferase [Chryseosolibacter sp.]|nr:decaprenyl-phosphate phosphoribosyltransferase [Chryseosolibacter sp.]
MESTTTTTTTATTRTPRTADNPITPRPTQAPSAETVALNTPGVGKGIVSYIKSIIHVIRVRQWIKNLFLFIPSFFAGHLFKTEELFLVGIGAVAFSLVASGVYVLNDYRDRFVDRLHPTKRYRPIASGEIGAATAWTLIVTLVISGLAIAAFLEMTFFYLLVTYLALNVGYSMGLKNIPIVDLFIVSLGFLLRIYSGGVIADLPITHWLSIMILLLALFLIIARRRDDILINAKSGSVIRKSIQAYNLDFINSCITLLSAVVIVAYIMYTVSPEVTERFNSDYLFVTTIFVIAGIMRYLQIIFVENKSGSPTRIFVKDKFILMTIAGWILSFYLIIYAL